MHLVGCTLEIYLRCTDIRTSKIAHISPVAYTTHPIATGAQAVEHIDCRLYMLTPEFVARNLVSYTGVTEDSNAERLLNALC